MTMTWEDFKKKRPLPHDEMCSSFDIGPVASCAECRLIDNVRLDERRRTLDDAEALIRAYFRQHGWQASANHLIEWLDRIA